MKFIKQNEVRNVWDKAGFWRPFGGVVESRKMRTEICETVKSWLLKLRVESSCGWWWKVGYSGGFDG